MVPVIETERLILRGFVRAEWEAMLAEARIPQAAIRWRPLFRLCVERLKPASA